MPVHPNPLNPTLNRKKWRFPEMGVSPNDCQMTYFNRMFHYKPSSYWGTPIYGNPHIWKSLRIWDHHRSKGCDAIFHCRLWPPAAAYDPPVSLGHRSTSETNGLGVSSEHQINELWFLRTTLICLFIYIHTNYTYYIYNIYIYTPVDHVYIYIHIYHSLPIEIVCLFVYICTLIS